MNVMLVGPMPTPAVAFLTRSLRADLGVMVSASHNPYHDNGIKLFGPDGFKLSDEIEDEIEAMIGGELDRRPGGIGRSRPGAPDRRRARPLHREPEEQLPARADPDRPQARRRQRPRRRLPPRRRPVLRAGRRGGAARHRAQRPQHQRRLRLERAGAAARHRACARGADLGHRARRRCRPPGAGRRPRQPDRRRPAPGA